MVTEIFENQGECGHGHCHYYYKNLLMHMKDEVHSKAFLLCKRENAEEVKHVVLSPLPTVRCTINVKI